MDQGWICPQCNFVHAPSVDDCTNCNDHYATYNRREEDRKEANNILDAMIMDVEAAAAAKEEAEAKRIEELRQVLYEQEGRRRKDMAAEAIHRLQHPDPSRAPPRCTVAETAVQLELPLTGGRMNS